MIKPRQRVVGVKFCLLFRDKDPALGNALQHYFGKGFGIVDQIFVSETEEKEFSLSVINANRKLTSVEDIIPSFFSRIRPDR